MERFSQRARRVLSLAHQEAERMRHNTINTEHLLLGLVIEEGGIAAHALRELGLESERVKEMVSAWRPSVLKKRLRLSFQLAHSRRWNLPLRKRGSLDTSLSVLNTCCSASHGQAKGWRWKCLRSSEFQRNRCGVRYGERWKTV